MSCSTPCHPMDCCLPGSSVHGISQARILEWVAIYFSRRPSKPRDWTCISCIGRWILHHRATGEALPKWYVQMLTCCSSRVWLCATRWTLACQAPLCLGFSGRAYWRGLPCPPPGNLPDPGIELLSLASPELAGGFFTRRELGSPPIW